MIIDVNGLNWAWHWHSGLAVAFLIAVAIYIRGWWHIVFSATATVLLRQWLGRDDEKPPLPDYLWSTDVAMLAPGFKIRPK